MRHGLGQLLIRVLPLFLLLSGTARAANEKGRTDLAWELLEADAPAVVWANRTAWQRLVIRNVGTATWSDADGDGLAYHWYDPHGRVVEYDGQRTHFGKSVPPSATVEVRARLVGPPGSGRFTLEWEPVREGVCWYGAPRNGSGNRMPVRAFWFAAFLASLACAFGLAFVVAIRRKLGRSTPSPLAEAGLDWVWPFFTWASVSLTVAIFSDLSGIEARGLALVAALSGAVWFALPVALAPRRAQAWIGTATVSVVALLALGDLIYLAFYGSIIPVGAASTAQNLGAVRESVLSLTRRDQLCLLPLPLTTFVMALVWPRRLRREGIVSSSHWRRTRLAPLAACLLAAMPSAFMIISSLRTAIGTHVVSETRTVKLMGFLNAHALDIAGKLHAASHQYATPAERARIGTWFADRAAARATPPPASGFGFARGRNLLLIQVESAQGWIVGAKVGDQEITPYLNELRASALYYPHVTDQTCIGMTADAEYAILNSQHPLPDESVAFLHAGNHFVTIAHALREAGYSTLSAHPFEKGFWNRSILHPRYGFERSLFRDELGAGMIEGWGLADGVLFERLLPVLKAAKSPFFAFVVTLSLHHPFEHFPPELMQLDLRSIENKNLANYIHGMNYFDRSFRAFVAELERTGLLQNTVVALYGDHDPRFGYDRELLALAGFQRGSPGVFNVIDRIPFFVLLPPTAEPNDLDGIHEVDAVGGHVDVAPTLLHFLGVPRPASFVGTAMISGKGPDYAARPDGSALTRERVFVARDIHLPKDGSCYSLPDLKRAGMTECRTIARAAASELEMSHRATDLDMQEQLAKTGAVAHH